MARYFIYEGNIERLEKKIAIIERKCAKYNLHFHYEQVGEEFHEVEVDGEKVNARFVEVEIEGLMKHQDWEFIAKVDHYEEGNIIRQFKTDIEVPSRYRHTDPICEHCNTHRGRKFTYLVHNTSTDEWKQVGSSCLKEFTMGLDAEDVARYISFFDTVIEFEGCYGGSSYTPYYDLKEFLCYAKETVNKFGYVSATKAEEDGDISTRVRTWNFYNTLGRGSRQMGSKTVIEEAERIGFDATTEEISTWVDGAINWIRNIDIEELEGNSYLFNLHLACSKDYFEYRNSGFIVSLMPTYYRHLADIEYKERKAREAKMNSSRYQGEVGQRISFKPASINCVCSNDSFYGISFLYRILDEAGNVFMWSTGSVIESDKDFQKITGTVKSHSEYNGTQQTFLTRCRIA